mmetsp:Transcript_32386/g.58862  ORF Transcript_32386/g.58862 Transcript_32386/m.58862 type:complete len:427 (+) Transcript_32386:1-1281(+)
MTMATTSTTASPTVFGSAQQVVERLAVAQGDDFRAAGRTHGFLVLVTTAHALLNFGIIGQAGIVGAMHEDMVRQAGSRQSGEVVLLLAGGLGAFGGNMVTGWWMDHFPSHYLFAACAFASAVNLGVMPHVSGLPAIATCNVLIQLGVGIGDCSYGALGWVARECGVSKDGAYTSIKNLGTGLGLAVLMGMAILLDYGSLAYTWSAVCLLAGSLILAMPSPTPPEGATVARETPGQARAIAWRETLVVCAGGLLSAVVVGIFVTSLNLTANWIGTAASRQLLLCMLCMNILGQLLMAPIMQRLPPAAAHMILLSISAVGCLLTGVAFAMQERNYVLIYTGYSLVGATLLSNFAVVFTFMSSLVSLSGSRSSIIGLGAALNPFFSAAAAVMQPAVVWIVSACLLLVMAAVVVLLEVFGARFVQRPRID